MLSSLKFTDEHRPTDAPDTPITKARAAVLKGIQNQRLFIQAERTGQPVNLTKTVTGKDGSERVQRLRPRKWFWRSPQGHICLEVFYGHRALPLHDGKAVVTCPDLDALEAALTVIAQSVLAGELDAAVADVQATDKRLRTKP
ncbi:hypothetical protein [Magnetospirillum sp. 64-120]|uniref:hypothetical protein n=1 Tax=Magnetospirillum sp. 64-120 TaxID=1895778 RepID=UPI00092A5946|nr:hypothetical protein [Magnetospirillum sp. 64-120]OJX78263.1 MAG: hypothetical protein BGO92_02505 [Magnetospirillum sp. 64-120]